MKTNLSFALSVLLAACSNSKIEDDLGADTADSRPTPWEDWQLDTGEPDPDEPAEQPAEEPSEDQARIVTLEIPTQLGCEESGYGAVLVENIGESTWTRADGFKLGAVNDDDPLFDSNDVRVWMDEDAVVRPGEQYRFGIDLRGRGQEAVETTDWQMVHEGVRWFGQIASAEVSVSCSGDAPDASPALPLPNMSQVVHQLASERPGLLAASCQDEGGSWAFMDELKSHGIPRVVRPNPQGTLFP